MCRHLDGTSAFFYECYKGSMSALNDIWLVTHRPQLISTLTSGHVSACSELEEPCLREPPAANLTDLLFANTFHKKQEKGKCGRKGRSAFPSSPPVCRQTHPALADGRLLFGDRCRTAKHKSGLLESAEWNLLASINSPR